MIGGMKVLLLRSVRFEISIPHTTLFLKKKNPQIMKRPVFSSEAVSEFHDIPCQINGEYTVECGRRGDEVYLPFSFIHKYFEVSCKRLFLADRLYAPAAW